MCCVRPRSVLFSFAFRCVVLGSVCCCLRLCWYVVACLPRFLILFVCVSFVCVFVSFRRYCFLCLCLSFGFALCRGLCWVICCLFPFIHVARSSHHQGRRRHRRGNHETIFVYLFWLIITSSSIPLQDTVCTWIYRRRPNFTLFGSSLDFISLFAEDVSCLPDWVQDRFAFV